MVRPLLPQIGIDVPAGGLERRRAVAGEIDVRRRAAAPHLDAASNVSRSSLNTPMLISASLIESSLFPFSPLPLMSDGTYCVVEHLLELLDVRRRSSRRRCSG